MEENKKKRSPLYWILLTFFGVVFLVCAVWVGKYLLEGYNNRNMQEDLQNMKGPTSSICTDPTTRPSGTTVPTDPTQSTGGTMDPTESTGSQVILPTEESTVTPTAPTQPPQILEEYQELHALNNHMVGWIYIPGTANAYQGFSGIDYPVLQTPNTTQWQNYYLYRDFYGNDSDHGWLFIREACDVNKPCDNIVIYGHNMADGTMFGQVVNYRNKSYYEEHKYIVFDTLYEHHTYEIIAVFTTSGKTGVGYPYHSQNDFATEEAFDAFIATIKGGASNVYTYYNIEATATYGDKLITLSTCWTQIYPDGRLVVVAKQIN